MRPDKTRTGKSERSLPRLALWVCAVIVFVAPAALQGEVVYLKDGSSIRGRVIKLTGDTLTFDPAFGGRIKIARSKITGIVFSDSAVSLPGLPGAGERTAAAGKKTEKNGFVSVAFKDRGVSSKVAVESKSDEGRLLEANYIVQLLIVNGDTVYSSVDSTTDKTVYKGHARIYRNNAEMQDVEVPLEPGLYHCVVVAHSLGKDWENVEFETDPLDISLNIDNVQVFSGRTTRVELGIKKGRFRLGKPQFYRVQ